MGLFDSILDGIKDVANSEINRKLNDTVRDIKGQVTEQVESKVDSHMENIKDKLTNAGLELMEKKFLLNLQKKYQDYGYDIKIDIDNDNNLSDEELNNAVSILNNFTENNRENVRSSMVNKGYTVEEADSLLSKEQEILRDMDNIRIYAKEEDEERREASIEKLNADITEFTNISIEIANKHPELKNS